MIVNYYCNTLLVKVNLIVNTGLYWAKLLNTAFLNLGRIGECLTTVLTNTVRTIAEYLATVLTNTQRRIAECLTTVQTNRLTPKIFGLKKVFSTKVEIFYFVKMWIHCFPRLAPWLLSTMTISITTPSIMKLIITNRSIIFIIWHSAQ